MMMAAGGGLSFTGHLLPGIGTAVSLGVVIWQWRAFIGAQKIGATRVVDDSGVILQDNLNAYFEERTIEAQNKALSNFEEVWEQVVERCSAVGGTFSEFADAGRRCINERLPGGVLDWFRIYRDPILATPPFISAPEPEPEPNGARPAPEEPRVRFEIPPIEIPLPGFLPVPRPTPLPSPSPRPAPAPSPIRLPPRAPSTGGISWLYILLLLIILLAASE